MVDLPPLSAAIARLCQDRPAALQSWRESANLPLQGEFAIGREPEYLALARVMLANGEAEAALTLAARLREGAEQGQRLAVLVEILILQSLALHACKASNEALPVLQQALALARQTGQVRVFIDAGAPMGDLLRRLARGADYTSPALTMLAHFGDGDVPGAPAPFAQLFSKKEKQVVSYVVRGDSNQKIAECLFISPNTLNSHMKSIYAKLGVNSRLQAIDQLRKLGMQ